MAFGDAAWKQGNGNPQDTLAFVLLYFTVPLITFHLVRGIVLLLCALQLTPTTVTEPRSGS
jgi:hypothetical protein